MWADPFLGGFNVGVLNQQLTAKNGKLVDRRTDDDFLGAFGSTSSSIASKIASATVE